MKLKSVIQITLLIGLMIVAWETGSTRATPSGRQIAINGMRLPLEQIHDIDRFLGYPLPDGRYWHDIRTGSWGRMGGPSLGLMPDGYVQQSHASFHDPGHDPGHGAVASTAATLPVSAMVDLDTDSNGLDDMSYRNN